MLLVPVVSQLAKKHHLVDIPGPRKVHQNPIPRIGGVAFVISTLALIVPVFFLNNDIGSSFRQVQTQFIVLLVAAFFVFLVGLVDDLHPIKGYFKLLCLIAASLAICASSATLRSISIGRFEIETGWLAWPLSVLWIVVITVGMNFIDGLDGLAAGIAAFVCGTILFLALWSGQQAMAVLMTALLGSITGFLFFNFYPAKIFMGDCGSMFLGFMIGAGSLVCQTKTNTLVGLAIPFLVMGLPILDTGFIIVSRSILERRSMFSPDKNHLHHRLLALGLQHRTVVIVFYAVTAICTSIGVFVLTTGSEWSTALLTGGFLLLFSLFVCLHSGRYHKMLLAVKRNWILARQAKQEMHIFEDTQVRMQESKSFDKWWETVCLMSKQMGFQSIGLWSCSNGNCISNSEWQVTDDRRQISRIIKLVLPLNVNSGWELRAGIYMDADGSLELSGRKAMLLSRLMDEFPPPDPQNKLVPREDEIQAEKLARKRALNLSAKIPEPLNIIQIPVTPFQSYVQILECVERVITSGMKSLCIAINPLKIYYAWQNPELLKILRQADFCICDGIGVSIASKIIHGQSIKRCTGCDLFFKIIALAAQKDWSVFLLGASAKSNSQACTNLKQKFPNLNIAGCQDGYFKDPSAVIEKINASGAKLLFVAMGSPKQEYWLWQHWESIKVNFCMGVGGSFDVAAGALSRAPKIFRATGTEFLYRLVSEPRKRWKLQKDLFPYFFKIIGKKLVDLILVSDDNQEQAKHDSGSLESQNLSEKEVRIE